MDADGLPLVGPGINLAQVDPIISKRMVVFMNHFLVQTVGHLNRFAVSCEEKLANLSVRLQRLETIACLLETKLQSIPGLEDITAASLGIQPATSSKEQPVVNGSSPAVTVVQTPTPAPAPAPAANQPPVTPIPVTNEAPEAQPAVANNKAINDPRYAKYFKLLGMQIPKMALQQRMVIEGLDPSVLDNPDAVVKPAGENTAEATAAAPAVAEPSMSQSNLQQKQESSDDDFSDDDDKDKLSSSASSASSSDFS